MKYVVGVVRSIIVFVGASFVSLVFCLLLFLNPFPDSVILLIGIGLIAILVPLLAAISSFRASITFRPENRRTWRTWVFVICAYVVFLLTVGGVYKLRHPELRPLSFFDSARRVAFTEMSEYLLTLPDDCYARYGAFYFRYAPQSPNLSKQPGADKLVPFMAKNHMRFVVADPAAGEVRWDAQEGQVYIYGQKGIPNVPSGARDTTWFSTNWVSYYGGHGDR